MPNLKSYIKLHIIIFIWGFTAVLGALIQLDYFAITWYRMGLASVFLFIYLISRKSSREKLKHFNKKEQKQYLVGGVIIALHWIAFFYAIKVSNVSITLVAMSSGAFFTSLIEPYFYKRSVRIYEILFGLLILFGLYILLSIEKIAYTGVLYALIAAFLSGLFSVINGIYVQKQNAYQLSFFQLFYGFIFLTIVLLFRGELRNLPMPSQSDWIYLFILASICTAYAFSASIDVMKHLSPYTVMLSINLEPVYGIILAILLLGDKEMMSNNFYLGASFILIIILLNTIFKHFAKNQR